MNKSKKGGNKRLVKASELILTDPILKVDYKELLREVQETEDIDRIIELTKCESE